MIKDGYFPTQEANDFKEYFGMDVCKLRADSASYYIPFPCQMKSHSIFQPTASVPLPEIHAR